MLSLQNPKRKDMVTRKEKDTLGTVEIDWLALWGAQTQRSLNNFKIGNTLMPLEIIYALTLVKKAVALTNSDLGVLPVEKKDLIVTVCDEILEGKFDNEFPLSVWQTGSGTQTNMNVNEVIATRAELLHSGGSPKTPEFILPNDDVNKSQSTNDVFPTAMRIAVYSLLVELTIPMLEALQDSLTRKANSFGDIIKIGRTHLMDATPLYLRDEFLTFAEQLKLGVRSLRNSLFSLAQLPIGGTAVGTGLNTPKGYDQTVIKYLNHLTGYSFEVAQHKFVAMASHDSFVEVSGAMKQLAVSLTKIGNDIRLLSSGPRCGLSEIHLPQNEPGSSIMPGKVNPTQCEALTMVCAQIVGNDAAITFAAMQGHLQLNAFMPVIAYNSIMSVILLADAVESFRLHCVDGIEPNVENIAKNLNNSLMLVTALNPHIGYYKSAEVAQYAHKENITLKQAALELGFVTEKEFEEWVNPKKMV